MLTSEGKIILRQTIITCTIIFLCAQGLWYVGEEIVGAIRESGGSSVPKTAEQADPHKIAPPYVTVKTNLNISPALAAYITALRNGERARELTEGPYRRSDALVDVIYYPPSRTLYGVFVVRGQPDYEYGFTSLSGPGGTWAYTERRGFGLDIWAYYHQRRTDR